METKLANINFDGISRSANDMNCKDGSCQEIINTRFIDGSWQPITTKAIIDQFVNLGFDPKTAKFYKHPVLGDGYYIAVVGQDVLLVHNGEFLTPDSYLAIASQSSTEFTLSVYIKGDYTIEKDQSWISLSKTTGNGLSNVTVTISASATTEDIGTITVTGDNKVFTCEITRQGININAVTPIATDFAGKTIEIPLTDLQPSDAEFTSSKQSDSDNMVSSLTDDQVNNKVSVVIAENNTVNPKTATIRISHNDFPTKYKDIVINQSIGSFTLDASPNRSWEYDELSAKTITVSIIPDNIFSVNLTGDTSRFSVVLNQVTNQITVTPLGNNTSGSNYVLNIEVTASGYTSDTVTCTQEKIPTISVSTNSVDFDNNGVSTPSYVWVTTSPDAADFSVIDKPSWIVIDNIDGNRLYMSANPLSAGTRSGYVTLKNNSESSVTTEIHVEQIGAPL